MESALLRFEVQIMILCNCENIFYSCDMVRKRCGRSNSNVVHINSDYRSPESVLGNDIFVYLIHHRLEGCGGVAEAKKHDSGLKESISCFERCFVFITFFDSNVVVSPSYVEL